MRFIYTIIRDGEENKSASALSVVERLTGLKQRTLHDNFKTRGKKVYKKKGYKIVKSLYIKNTIKNNK